ncbi:DEAD/DEAH box helicase [Acetonema longum]|nr:DEAD/DEAH box helicase [Acetonema longum]
MTMSTSFETLGVIASLTAGLHTIGIETPTPIQARVIPPALAGKDVIGQSATGTGKTLAYLLPVMQKLDTARRENQVLILAPTHELAIQIQRRIEEMAKTSGIPLTAAPIIGNVNIERQIDKLKEKPHIITGSSGRILELIQKKKINPQTVQTIILDEADRLLDDQNLDSVKAVIKTTLRQRQIMLFSATIPAATLARAKEFMADPAIITVIGQEKVPEQISHLYFVSEQREKIELLRKLTRAMDIRRALVFVNKGENIDLLVSKLNFHGIPAAGLYGGAEKKTGDRPGRPFKTARQHCCWPRT